MSQMMRGHLELAVLRVLREGECHGYGIVKTLNQVGSDALRSGEGTIYPLLRKLEQEGQVISRWSEGRKLYRLSSAGDKTFEQNKNEWLDFSDAIRKFLTSSLDLAAT